MTDFRQDPLVRLAHLVGDFASPFYAEERQRDVWNEASAFGLQLALWCVLATSTVALWCFGRPALPSVLTALAITGVVCLLTIAYASRLGVSVTEPMRCLRMRMLPLALLMAALVAGLVRARGGAGSFGFGIAAGALAALGLGPLLRRRDRS